MKKLRFLQGKSNPCIYFHPARELRSEVRGDDFTTVGSFDDIKWFHTSAAKEWQVVERGILGPPGSPKPSQQIRVLNRINTWSKEGIWWEPDPRHAELITKWLGTGQPGKVKTPLAKPSQEEQRCIDHRSIAMRAANLAQDRPDLDIDQELHSCFHIRAPASLSICGQTPTVQDALIRARKSVSGGVRGQQMLSHHLQQRPSSCLP